MNVQINTETVTPRTISPSQIGTLLCEYVNTMSRFSIEAKEVASQIARDHPTLQQAAVRFLLNILLNYKPYTTDLRNEGAAALCDKLRQLNLDGQLPYLPIV